MYAIIVSLRAQNDESILAAARPLAGKVAAAEIRLDLMARFDLPRLLTAAPLPFVVTYRPVREGGHFTGSETERLHRLRQAATLGAYAVDVEWDVAPLLADLEVPRIVSRHFFVETPTAWADLYAELAATEPQVVKIAARANRLIDALRLAQLWLLADRPLVAIAMGRFGMFTRLLAPFFRRSWFSYAAVSADAVVAPGQLAWRTMLQDYDYQRVSPRTNVLGVLLSPEDDFNRFAMGLNCYWREQGDDYWAVPLYWRDESSLDAVRALWFALGTRALWWPERSLLWVRGEDGNEQALTSTLPDDLPMLA